MNKIDDLSPPLRALVHDYGWTTVDNFMRLGVTNPRHIKHLVETGSKRVQPDARIIVGAGHHGGFWDSRQSSAGALTADEHN